MEGARIAVFGAPGEEAQAMPVVHALPEEQVIDLVGKTTPMEAATILSQCDLFVGNDSGLMHTAVAVDINTSDVQDLTSRNGVTLESKENW